MKYKIRISETLSAEVCIEASDKYEALEKAEQMYDNCDVLLMADNFDDVSFKIKEMIEND